MRCSQLNVRGTCGELQTGQSKICAIRRFLGMYTGGGTAFLGSLFGSIQATPLVAANHIRPSVPWTAFGYGIYSLGLSRKAIGGIESLPLKAIRAIPQSPVYLILGNVNNAICRVEPKPVAPGINNSRHIQKSKAADRMGRKWPLSIRARPPAPPAHISCGACSAKAITKRRGLSDLTG